MKIAPLQTAKINNYGINSVNLPCKNKQNQINKNITELPNTYYMPVSFTGRENRTYSTDNQDLFEIPSDFQIGKFKDVPCPACGRKMLNKDMFLRFKKEIDASEPQEYMSILERWQDYMMPVELKAFEDIKQCAKEHPEMSVPNDLRTSLVILRNSKLPQLQAVQMKRVKKMRSLARTLPEEEKVVLNSKLDKLQKIIKKTGEESPFRRKIMIDKISKIKISNPNKYKKLQTIAASFPTSNDIHSAWIVKYSGKNKLGEDWSSYDIALRLLASSVANTDHIRAYSTDPGHDDISNYMSMHTGCNTRKSNKPFLQWYYEDKNLRNKSLKAYFEKADEIISSGELSSPKYRDYVAKATQTISEVSKGKVNIKL